jgi:GH18 family chitinase
VDLLVKAGKTVTLLALLLVTSLFAEFGVDPATREFADHGKNIVYVQNWFNPSNLDDIDFTHFEYICYAFYTADGKGDAIESTIHADLLTKLVYTPNLAL